ERAGLRRGVEHQRILHRIEMRLHELGRRRHRDMGMDVDGDRLRPYLAAGLAVFACGGRRVFIPLGHRAFLSPPSFRSAPKGRESGIHTPQPWLWIPGYSLRSAPE